MFWSSLVLLHFMGYIMCTDLFSSGCVPDPSLFSSLDSQNIEAYLDAFEQGGCAPVVLLPGVFGSKIQVEIDCELMSRDSPEVFTTCGWNSCNRDSNPLERLLYGLSVPEQEYSLWIPQINTPMSPLQLTTSESLCFNYLLAMQPDEYVSKVAGVTFKIYGQTPGTKNQNHCGDTAVRDLFDYFSSDCDLIGYGSLLDRLKEKGYHPGITYQSLPYDFRVPSKHNPVIKQLKMAVEKLYLLNNNKKVIVVAHSYGNIMTVQSLHSQFSQQEKDKMVLQYIAVGAPLGGVVKSARVLLGGYAELHKYGLGFDYRAQQSMILSSGTLIETLPFKYLYESEDEPWMHSLKQRIEIEKKGGDTSGRKDSWLPGPQEQCYQQDSGEMGNTKCGLFLDDFLEMRSQLIQIKEGNKTSIYGVDTLNQLIRRLNVSESLLMDCRTNNSQVQDMPFPGVNTLFIMGTTFRTEAQLKYDQDPVKVSLTQRTITSPSQTRMSYGDSTINHWSILVPLYKWLYEGVQEKSLRLAQFCSSYGGQHQQQRTNKNTDQMTLDGTGHAFMGLDCSCNEHYDHQCSHACQINNRHVMSFLVDTLAVYRQETRKQKNNRMAGRQDQRDRFIDQYSVEQEYCQSYDMSSLN